MKLFFDSNSTKSYEYRISMLNKLETLININEKDILAAMTKDLGKSYAEGYITEIAPLKKEIAYYKKNLKKFMKPLKVSSPITIFPARSYIVLEPKGVILSISPWNYPALLMLAPLIAAIATGNCTILKPSEISVHTSALLANIINNEFNEAYICVILGDVTVTSKLLEHRFDHIFFTGSTNVGRIVMQQAANHLTPVTLELGGKSPAIVDETAKIDIAAKRIVWGKLLNSGQTCIAPDYIYAHSSIKSLLIEKMKFYINKFYTSDPLTSPEYASMINKKHFDRVVNLIDINKIVYGGKTDQTTNKIEPTIIDNVTLDDNIMKEEIFGPLFPIIEYVDLTKVIGEIKSGEKPLSLYIFTNDKTTKDRIISEISFGGGVVNDTLQHLLNDNLPFGGVGSSGVGRYHGIYGFQELSHAKSIVEKCTKLDLFLRYPPFKNKLKLLKLFLK